MFERADVQTCVRCVRLNAPIFRWDQKMGVCGIQILGLFVIQVLNVVYIENVFLLAK